MNVRLETCSANEAHDGALSQEVEGALRRDILRLLGSGWGLHQLGDVTKVDEVLKLTSVGRECIQA